MQEPQAYVYIWRHKRTENWYIGARWQDGCNPNDGYKTSNPKVRAMITSSPNDWERQLIYIGDPNVARELESQILQNFDARLHPASYNMHNNNGGFSKEFGGEFGGKHSTERREKQSKDMKERWCDPDFKRKQAEKRKSRVYTSASDETKAKMSASQKGKKRDQPTVTCPHCNKSGKAGGMGLWHFDNCRYKNTH